MATDERVKEVRDSLQRVQEFEPQALARREDLGRLNFEEAVPSARQCVELVQRISSSTLDVFSDSQLQVIRSQADGLFNLLQQIAQFDPEKVGNAAEERRGLINQLQALPEQLANSLWQHIAYSVASSLDPITTQQEMRSIAQRFSDEREKALASIEGLKADAEEVLSRVRAAAAEQGVSQQASYFKTMADEHSTEASTWLKYSLWAAATTLLFAIISALSYRIPWLAPENTIETVQLITSKLVILSILGYAMFVAVRNFLSHKHNSVVNRHRQNALLTYTAFVDAAPSTASREIVLTHAAASVFSPQDTGYIRQEEPPGGKSVLEMVTKASLSDPKGP